MNIRPKTIRRLAILFAGFLILAGGVAVVLFKSWQRQKADVAGLRVSAMKAFELKDYPAAVSLFHDYVGRSHPEGVDSEVLYEYGTARIEVPEEGNRQITEGIDLLQRYLNLAPGDPHDASHALLKLYVRARYNNDAKTMAGKLLAKNPGDVEALRARAEALISDHNTTDALAACGKLNQVAPLDLLWQKNELLLMAELKRSSDQIVSHAKDLLAKHPDDPRFHALMAIAYGLINDRPNRLISLQAAATLPPSDTESVLQILTLLSEAQRIDLYDLLIARAVAKDNDPRLERLWLQRLFEQERYTELVDRLKNLDPKSPQTQSAVLGYEAMALYELHRKPQADAILNAMSQRKDESFTAWPDPLRARYIPSSLEPAALLKIYHDATEHDRSNPVFHLFLGDAHIALSETDEAVREWALASRLSPTWALPLYRISRTLSAVGRYSDALRAATYLVRRSPQLPASEIAYVIAGWGAISNKPQLVTGKEGEGLLKMVEALRAKIPGETDTLPAYIGLLSRRGQRDKAIEVVKAALAVDPPLPEATFGELAAASEQEKLGLTDAIVSRAQKAHGQTPAVAFSSAYALYEQGKRPEALQLVESFRQTHPNDPVWQLNEARFRDMVGDPGALKAWITVCDAHPADIRVQYQALSSRSRFSDRAFWKRIIDRVKALTGPDAQAWQIEQARYDVYGQPSEPDLETDIASLQKIAQSSAEILDVHLLLAQAMLSTQKQEYIPKATAELTTAHELQPDDFQSTSQLAPLLVSQGLHEKALGLVNEVCAAPALPMDRRLWAAKIYAELGQSDSAMKLLTAEGVTDADPARDALLATLYTRAGRLDEATTLYKKILEAPTARIEALGDGVEFFAVMRQPDQVARFLERIKKMPMAPGTVEMLQAHLDEMQGKAQEALTALIAATKTFPKSEQVWLELSGFYLRFAKLDLADKAAADGLAAVPAAAELSAMRLQIGRIRSIDSRDLTSLINVLSRTPRQPIADAALKTLAEARARNDSPPQILSNLRQLADAHPRFLPLQELLIRRYLAASRFKDAAEVASRTCEIAPYDLPSMQLMTTVEMLSKNWEGARAAALRWRQASGVDTVDPDISIALTYLQQPVPDPDAALRQLEPYVADKAPEAQKRAATPAYCRALLAAGRIDDAANRLLPLVDKSPGWIAVWLELATVGPNNADAAAQWLKRIEPGIHADAAMQRVALAAAWEHVGQKFDSTPAHQAARDLLQAITSHSPVPPPAWWQWAIVNQSLGNFAQAERGWEEYLMLNSKDAQGLNNLAYVLLLEGTPAKLPKAEKLATDAIHAYPSISTFYDTLGRIQLQAGKTAQATKNFRLALEKDPNDLDAMIGLADTLQSQPSGREEVRSLIPRINAIVDGGTPLTPPIRKQLDRVKSAMTSSL